jgi:hypothetical protein
MRSQQLSRFNEQTTVARSWIAEERRQLSAYHRYSTPVVGGQIQTRGSLDVFRAGMLAQHVPALSWVFISTLYEAFNLGHRFTVNKLKSLSPMYHVIEQR